MRQNERQRRQTHAHGGVEQEHPTRSSVLPLRGAAFAAVAAIVLGLGAYLTTSGGSDSISDSDSTSRLATYQTFVAAGGLAVHMVSPEDLDEAVASMNFPEERQDALREDVEAGRVLLAWLTLWDTHAEDGDVLRFESDSAYPVEITALNNKTTVAIPYPVSGTVKVIGVHDGGGGITIALESGATQISWPTMRPGDSLELPVKPGL